MKKHHKKLLLISIMMYTLVFLTNCTKEKDEEPIVNELEIKEDKLCKTWHQDYLLIDGDTADYGPYYYQITIDKNKDYTIALYKVNEQGETIDTTHYFTEWRWADHTNAIVVHYVFDEDFWWYYKIKSLDENEMIIEEDTDNGVYVYFYSAVND